MTLQHRDFVWECDYGEHSRVLRVLKTLLADQNADELAMCALFVNSNPYNLEFFVVLGYERPTDNQIQAMRDLLRSCGARYRPDIPMDELLAESGRKRFNMATAAQPDSVDIAESLFRFKERSEIATVISMRPLGKTLPVFISHASYDKPFVEDVIPYLTAKGLPVWYDKVSIDYGQTIVTAIQEGISSSGAVIFFVTPYFLKSSWCEKEMEGFLTRFGTGHDILLLTAVDSAVAHEDLPLFLQMKKYVRLPEKASSADLANELIPSIRKHFKL
ncbi:toll/interleukin-1 receptor domain-containing protein [Propionivibrio sp.]|uniref:toll/interleukin-1 receptor domain-containing protein n=1 Tax=Propionivibrio sp. TaxID=2212460 RepID=UPI0039E66A25